MRSDSQLPPSGYVNSLLAMWALHSWSDREFNFSPNPLSGWTLGTTTMTGQSPTTWTVHITCRSDLSHQAGLNLNPDNQLSVSQCIVRPHPTLFKPNLTIQGEISKTQSRHQTARSSQTDSYFQGGWGRWGTVTFYFLYGRSARYGTPCPNISTLAF